MSRIIRLLACAFVFFFLPHAARAGVNLYGICTPFRANAVNGATNDCDIQNTTAGQKVVISLEVFGASFVVTGTETITCPALAISPPNTGYFTQICYSDTASSHADFNIHTVLTCSTCSASNGLNSVEAVAVDGLVAGHDCANSAAAQTVNCTTTHAGDWGFMAGHDFSSSLAPGSGFSNLGSMTRVSGNMTAATQQERTITAFLLTGGAGSITASYTNTNSFPAPTISVIYFQTSGGVTPQVPMFQYCGLIAVTGANPTTTICRLYTTTTPHTVISGWWTNGGIADGGSTETILYPTNSQNRPSGAGTSEGIGYVITASNHATFDVLVNVNGGNSIGIVSVLEVGNNLAIDSGSEAHAAATSTAFTTAANNEQSFFNALDDANNLMVPTNSFVPLWFSINHSVQTGLLLATRRLATSGSYTASYTQTGSSTANIGELAFTVASSARKKHKSQIIRYKPLVKPEILLAKAGVH